MTLCTLDRAADKLDKIVNRLDIIVRQDCRQVRQDCIQDKYDCRQVKPDFIHNRQGSTQVTERCRHVKRLQTVIQQSGLRNTDWVLAHRWASTPQTGYYPAHRQATSFEAQN